MKWIRIGNRVLNSEAIIEVVDQATIPSQSGPPRFVQIRLSDGSTADFTGAQADTVWEKVTKDAETLC